MKDFMKNMLHDFFNITAGILIAATVYCTVFVPEGLFGLNFLWQIIALGFFSTLPNLIFYAKKELSKRQMFTRQIIHACVLLVLLLSFAFAWGWIAWGNIVQLAFFVLLVLCVYITIYVLSFLRDQKVAKQLNAKLRQYKSTKSG